MRPYDLLVFDWDGTLVDSIGSIVDCTERALTDAGVDDADRDTIRHAIGLGIREMIDAIVPGCDDALFERICLSYREHWFAGLGAQHRPFEGVDELLTGLVGSGYLLAVATAKSRRGLVADFDRTGLRGFFHGSRTVNEAPPKPHPAMLEDLCQELGTRPGRSLMIGDTTHDLEMAANAGVAGLGVLSGSQGAEQMARAPHLALLDSVRQLPGWLAESAPSSGAPRR